MTHFARMLSICLITFAVSGCYTQIRSPEERGSLVSRASQDLLGPVPGDVTQRFDYYNSYGRNRICDPYDFSRIYPYPTYDFYDANLQLLYTRRPRWYTSQLAWEQACWVSVYDRIWCGLPPKILVPQIVYRSPIVIHHNPPPIVIPQKTQPRPTRVVVDGVPPSSSGIRTNPVRTRPPQSSDTSSKQATPEKKKEEEKKEKREEKRKRGTKRGGMR